MNTGHPIRIILMFIASAVIAGAQSEKECPMKISSTDFNQGGSIPPQFTCDGENVNPSL